MTGIAARAGALTPSVLTALQRGIEKESLRVMPDGRLAETPHPEALGSALAHPGITTDFSEAQLELITGVHADVEGCLRELTELHQVVYRAIGDELLWCASMPCALPADERIPIARYGRSNIGRLKSVYRHGLSHRYGRRMQAISGIHYNFSLPEAAWPLLAGGDARAAGVIGFRDRHYLRLIRNFRRHSWLLLLLLGSAPVACACYVTGRQHGLSTLGADTVYAPHATSLRMGPLGYQSQAQSQLAVSFNTLGGYAQVLHRALTTPHARYEAIGLRDGDEHRQLATTLLQIENEFYGSIRPKRRTGPGERPLHALGHHGIEYVEVRSLDVDPFKPVGIDAPALRLLDVFLLHCLLADSPPDSPSEIETISRNQRLVAEAGRDPALRLDRGGEAVAPAEWGRALLEEFAPLAAALDAAHGDRRHAEVLAAAGEALREPASLPSARVLAQVERAHGGSYRDFGLAWSRRHREEILALPFGAEVAERHARRAAESLAEQRRIEAADDVPFETFLRSYVEQELLGGPHFDDARHRGR